jgi:hypothetical protein
MYRRHLGRASAVGAALALILAFPAPALAKKFQMSGTWIMRKGQTFIPLQFAQSAGGSQMTHVSMGNLTEAQTFFPPQIIADVGGVTTSGAVAPKTLKIPKHRFVDNYGVVLPLFGSMLVQITTMFAIDAPFQSASFMAGAGPGALTWCPSNPACVAAGLPPGAAPNNGRVRYIAPGLQFGGTMQMGLLFGGIVSTKGPAFPGLIAHVAFGGSGTTVRNLAVGGPQAGTNTPATEMVLLAAGPLTLPGMFPLSGSLILSPGPVVGMLPEITSSMGGMGGSFTTNYGFGHTTGTVVAQQITGTGGDDFFTVMGSDMRTAGGGGNITTVAGGLARRNNAGGQTTYAMWDKVSMTLGPAIPSMSPAGFAAAGALLVLAAGYALRRRLP